MESLNFFGYAVRCAVAAVPHRWLKSKFLAGYARNRGGAPKHILRRAGRS